MEEAKLTPQIFAALSATVLAALAGFHTGWSSPMLPKLLEDTSVPVTPAQASWIVSFMGIGSIFGPLCIVLTVDRWGRKTSMLLVSIPFLVSSTLTAFAQTYWWYYVARFACGVATGATWSIVPMYLGEIAEDRIRGGFGVLMIVMFNFGTVLAYSIGAWVSVPVLSVLGIVIPVLFLATFAQMPETPYFYTMKYKPQLARRSLRWLRGTMDVDVEVEVVKRNVEYDLQSTGTLKELFSDKGNRRTLLIVIALVSAQQLCGITAVLSYSTTILNEANSGITSSIAVIITGVVQIIFSMLILFVADRFGRRPLLLGSMTFSITFLIGIAVYFQLQANGNDVSNISWLPVTAMIGFICSFSMGLGTLPISIISEVFQCSVKAYAVVIVMTHLSLVGAVVLQFYPAMANSYGVQTPFFVFAICTTIFMIFTFFYLPETKGKSLGAIQRMLHERLEAKPILQLDSIHDSSKKNNSLYFIAMNSKIN